MFNRNQYHSAFDPEHDGDLVVLMNQTSDPEQLQQLAEAARERLKARHREARAQERARHSTRRWGLPRVLSPRTRSH